ncbi:MAG TPA: glycosyltransferase family 4 protein [Solirubrobacteraceae bacterium]|jgi:glycosyltransferase involved in cell wall biosynthesis|nr:glycosyltransferase family 4 protein [Solirubrobacteraceae bacterium]
MDATASTTRGAVVLVTPRWTRDGGVAAHVQVSAAALAERGVDVRVVAETIDAEPDAPDVPLVHAPALFARPEDIGTRLAGVLAGEPAVVHLHQVDDPKIVAAARRHAPVVVSAHGYTGCTSGVYYFEPGHECSRAHGIGCIPNLIARGCAHTAYPKTLPRKFMNTTTARSAIRAADLAVSYSTAVDRHLANNGLERRLIVPYFPTMPARSGAGHAARRRVVFAGRIVRPKGVDVLIEAACEVDAEFVLCGDGRDLDAMRALARERGVQERVQFTGWLDAGGLAQQLADASVVAVPSLWPEPFGLVGIEGFAAGRPAVGSATGGIPDWLDDGESGIAVPPADPRSLASALTELLDDPARQERMGALGRERTAARFTAERHVSVLMGGYERAREHWLASGAGRD